MRKGAATGAGEPTASPTTIFAFGAFQLDLQDSQLSHSGTPVKIEPRVLRLLGILVERAGEVVTKQELLARVWDSHLVSENVLTVAMARLRVALKQFGDEADFVATAFGQGYRFVRPIMRYERLDGRHKGSSFGRAVTLGLVGRDGVLNAVRSLTREAARGHGHAVLVSGEPGIGKTCTVELLAREAEAAGYAVMWAYCRERGASPPLWPFAQLVRGALAKADLENDDPRQLAAMRELSRLAPQLDQSVPSSTAPLGRGSVDPAARQRVFDVLTRALLTVAAARPCVLVLEDLHQADAATLELLDYLIDELTDARLLVLMTLRGTLAGSRIRMSRATAQRNCSAFELKRLSEAEVGSYVSAAGITSPNLARATFLKSQGNPFIMHELLRQLGADPNLDPEALIFSDATLELANQRMRELSEAARSVLEGAAVIGATFELPLLESVVGIERDALMTCLEAAWADGILVAAPDSRTEYAFEHELLREALYQRLAPARRRSLHLAIARALEQRLKGGFGTPVFGLAHHLYAAFPQTDLRACVRYCGVAAEEAGQSFAYADGARYLRQAREALDLLPARSSRLRLKLMFGQAVFARACSSSDQESLVRELLDSARSQRDPLTLSRATLLVDLHPGFPVMSGARAALDDALAMLPASERGLRAALIARSATSAPEAYDAELSAARIADALELIGDVDAPIARYAALSAQLYLLGGPTERLKSAARLHELEAFCSRHPKLYSLPPAFFELHRAITAQQDGDLPAQDAALLRCEKMTRALGSSELLWHCQRFRALSRFNLGQVELGESLLRALHQRAADEGLLGARLLCMYDQIVVFGEPLVGARHVVTDVLSFEPADTPSIWSIKVRVLAAAGLLHEARAMLSMVPASGLARLPCDRDYLGTLGTLTRAVIALDIPAFAEALYGLLAPFPDRFAANVGFRCEGSVTQLLGLLAGSLGRRAEASERLTASIELSERAGLKMCARDARLELALLRGRSRS